jgi:hypothetical protein
MVRFWHVTILALFLSGHAHAFEANRYDHIWSEAKITISEFWAEHEGSGLEHTSSNRDEVLAAFERYVTKLKSTQSNSADAVLDAIRQLYSELDVINQTYDASLLETEERELLVPIIVDFAVTAGLNPDNYGGEPGGEYRNF